MLVKPWIVFNVLIIGCVTIEIGVFLKKLDSNLNIKLANPHEFNITQLFQDVAAYSFNIKRLVRLFKLKREPIVEAAKMLHGMEHPIFIRNFSCEKVKTDFSLNERQYKDLLNFMEKITTSLREFYEACKENPGFVSIPLINPEFALEKNCNDLEIMFKTPDQNFTKYKVLKTAEEYYYNLGKFTKKFILGRRAVMNRAKQIFETGGPQFLRVYDYFKVKKAYKLSISEASVLDNYIKKITMRYNQFTNACFQNPYFESKIDFSSIKTIRFCEQTLKDMLTNPSPKMSEYFFKQVREFYHVLGFLRRYNIPHRTELLKALYDTFGTGYPSILMPLNMEKLKTAFQLNDSMTNKLEEYIGHLRRRFHQVQNLYLISNFTESTTLLL